MHTPHRIAVGAVAALLLVSLTGCVIAPLPYSPPYASPASHVNNANHALAGQAVYAPVYPGAQAYPVEDYGTAPPGGYDYGYADPNVQGDVYGGPAGYAPAAPGYSDSTGQIVDIRRLSYRGNPQASSAAGTAIGGIVGGVIGHNSGRHWNRGPNTLAGVLAGALIGSAIGTATAYQTSAVMYRVTARMDSGAMRTVDYANPPSIRIGDRVGFDGQQFYR